MKRLFLTLSLLTVLLAACAPVDLNAPIPSYDTGIDPNTWVQIPAGEFYFGQHEDIETTDAYEIMITNVTAAQYAAFLNAVLAEGYVRHRYGQEPPDPTMSTRLEEAWRSVRGRLLWRLVRRK